MASKKKEKPTKQFVIAVLVDIMEDPRADLSIREATLDRLAALWRIPVGYTIAEPSPNVSVALTLRDLYDLVATK